MFEEAYHDKNSMNKLLGGYIYFIFKKIVGFRSKLFFNYKKANHKLKKERKRNDHVKNIIEYNIF